MVAARRWYFKKYSLVGWGQETGTGLGEMRGSRRDCEGAWLSLWCCGKQTVSESTKQSLPFTGAYTVFLSVLVPQVPSCAFKKKMEHRRL